MKIVTPAQIIEADRTAESDFSIPSLLLMEQAAFSAASFIQKHYPGVPVALYAGPGNNGADALALARILHCSFNPVKIYILPEESRLKGLCRQQYQILQTMKLPVSFTPEMPEDGSNWLLVDGLFGTGLNRPLEGIYKDTAERINHSPAPVVSLDIPSGINGETGTIPGVAIQADYTVCFGLPKRGNLLYPGFSLQGELFLAPLSYPRKLWEELTLSSFEFPELPETDRQAYKGSRGYGLVIGGSDSYRGAPGFAAAGSLQSGGGYVHLALPESLVAGTASWLPEGVYHPMKEKYPGILSLEHLEQLTTLTQKMDWVILGPGLGRHDSTGQLLRQLIPRIQVPLILDGDALALIGNHSSLLKDHKYPVILTPHPGDAALLMNISVEELLSNPLKNLLELSKKFASAILLKQPHSLFSADGESGVINLSGSPVLATAGSGDILCGVIASMIGRDLSLAAAVPLAVFIHGLAGEILENKRGSEGFKASDILQYLPLALKKYRSERLSLMNTGNGRIKPL